MISEHNIDTIKYILKHKSEFKLARKNMLGFRDGKYYMNITKNKDGNYGIYIYHISEQIHKFNILKTDHKYNDIKTFVDSTLTKLDKIKGNEQLLVKMLGKDNRYHKIKKIRNKINN